MTGAVKAEGSASVIYDSHGPSAYAKDTVEINAPGKLIAIIIVAVGCLGYIITCQFTHGDATPAWATLTLITGYLIGNGAGARKGQPQEPVFKPNGDDKQLPPPPVN